MCVAERGQAVWTLMLSLLQQLGPGWQESLEPTHTGTPTGAGLMETDLWAQGLEGNITL